MSIFKRMLRIGRANTNAVLDELEDPVKMIDQVLRELDEDVAKVTAAVTTQMAVEKRFERELNEAIEMVNRRDQQARTALARDEEELARQALLEKNRFIEKRDSLQRSFDQAKTNSDKLRKQLQDMKSRVNEMKNQRGTLIAQAEAAEATKKINETMAGVGTQNLGDTFARMEERINQMHDQADAAHELANEGATLDDKFQELEKSFKEQSVDDELAALREELNKN